MYIYNPSDITNFAYSLRVLHPKKLFIFRCTKIYLFAVNYLYFQYLLIRKRVAYFVCSGLEWVPIRCESLPLLRIQQIINNCLNSWKSHFFHILSNKAKLDFAKTKSAGRTPLIEILTQQGSNKAFESAIN